MTTPQRLLDPLRGKGDLHTAQIARLWGLEYRAASRHLKRLVNEGHMTVRGNGLRIYRLKEGA